MAKAKNLPATVQRELNSYTPSKLLQQAITSGAGVDVLERLMALQERWDANQATKAFNAAMSDMRNEIPAIIKNRTVDFTSTKGTTHYRYEDLNGVTETLSPIMAKHGLSFRWRTKTDKPNEVSVTCIVSHRDGHFEETTLTAANDHSGNKNDIQSLGSAVTYLQRYTLKAALGVAAAGDDDGRSSQNGDDPKQDATKTTAATSPQPQKQNPPAQTPKGKPKELSAAHRQLHKAISNYAKLQNPVLGVEQCQKILKDVSTWEGHPGSTSLESLTANDAIMSLKHFNVILREKAKQAAQTK